MSQLGFLQILEAFNSTLTDFMFDVAENVRNATTILKTEENKRSINEVIMSENGFLQALNYLNGFQVLQV